MLLATKVNKSFNSCSQSNSNVILNADEPERLMRRTYLTIDSSYHTAHASTEILARNAEIMNAWTKDLEDHHGEDAGNGDEDIKAEDE